VARPAPKTAAEAKGESVLSFIDATVGPIMTALMKSDTSEAVATIASHSPLDPSALAPVREKLAWTILKFGDITSWDLAWLVADGGNPRSYRIRLLLVHQRAASAITATLFKGAAGWAINAVAVETENVFRQPACGMDSGLSSPPSP
jgi:hypothetical protein